MLVSTTLLALAGCGDDPASVGPDEPTLIDFTALDTRVDPCRDFYRFACGGWMARNPLTPAASSRSRGQDAFYEVVPILEQIVTGDAGGQRRPDDPYAHLIGAYYNSCNASLEQRDGRFQLVELLRSVGAVNTPEALAREVGVQRFHGSASFFSVIVAPDPRDPTRQQVTVDQGGWELPGRQYYLDPAHESVRSKYRIHIQRLSGLLNVAELVDPEVVIRIERALAEAALPPEQRRDPMAHYNPMPWRDFVAMAPWFHWDVSLRATGLPPVESLNVVNPSYFQALNRLLTTTPLAELKMYLRWQVIDDFADSLDGEVVNEEFDFHGRTFSGAQQLPPRPWTCFLDTLDRLGFAVARPFVARHFSADARATVQAMVMDLRAALERRLASVRWLDEGTRREALAKLSGLLPKVGFPDHWPTYESVRLSPTASLLANDLELNHRLWVIAGLNLGKPVDRGAWHMSPIEVNAYYAPLENSVVFPAGILRPPFFGLGFTEASNHGAIGSMVGHELTHGFDDQGRQFDGSGALRSWWSAAVEGMFRERAQCLVDQANAFEAVPGVRLDGRLSLGENIADLGGLKVAHDAFVARGAPGRMARGFDPRQQLFLSYAQMWCENQRPELTATLLRADPHAPASYRVNGVLTNMSEFAAAFRCPVGSPMVSASPCEVW